MEQLGSDFFRLLDELTIARSRKHIERFYADSIAEIGGFPERAAPLSLYPKIDLSDRFLSYDRLNDEILRYQLALFNPSRYVREEHRARYERDQVRNFSQSTREHFLIGMMKVNFLKRLESSVASFVLTIERTVTKIEVLELRIAEFKQRHSASAELDLAAFTPDDSDDDDLQAALEVGKRLVFRMEHLDVDRWLTDLRRDKEQLLIVGNSAASVTPARDAKLAELKQLIAQKVQQPTITKHDQPNRKVLVFTAFADTARYLYDALQPWASDLGIHSALVVGSGENKTTFGNRDFAHILTHFAPRAKQRAHMPGMPQTGEIDLLIATDCISEGQNLQDCDYLVNYDIHWNPVRIIQRFGRIDRIGSPNTRVQLVNFWPTPDLNKYLNLKERVESRMALVDLTATGDDNLLLPAELTALASSELDFRDQQLKRLQHEVLDLEEINGGLALTAFTLDDFRIELANYIESNRQLLQDAPLGLYAVVPTDPAFPVIAPGVVYCLRQLGDTAGNEVVNPLQPFFLVYVRDDGEVRFTFAHPKQILDMYRTLCAGKQQPYRALCDLFDHETHDGADMSRYSDLLERAVESITSTFQKRVIGQLQSGRDGKIVEQRKQASTTADFELITWLVIMAAQSQV